MSDGPYVCDVCEHEAEPAIALSITKPDKSEALLVCSACEGDYDPDDLVECAKDLRMEKRFRDKDRAGLL